MPSKKIISVLIFCVGLVASVWMWSNAVNYVPEKNTTSKNTPSDSVTAVAYNDNSSQANSQANEDWKKILVNLNQKDVQVKNLTTAPADNIVDTSITAQVSKDLLSQALVSSKNGPAMTKQNADAITQKIIDSQAYVKTEGAKYIASNLHTTSDNSKDSLKKYYVTLNKVFRVRLLQIKTNDEPMAMLDRALKNDDPTELKGMDEYIIANQAFINDLLGITVPSDVVGLHLELLNAASNILSNLQTMKNAFGDPVGAMGGMGQYNIHLTQFVDVMKKVSTYFDQKLK